MVDKMGSRESVPEILNAQDALRNYATDFLSLRMYSQMFSDDELMSKLQEKYKMELYRGVPVNTVIPSFEEKAKAERHLTDDELATMIGTVNEKAPGTLEKLTNIATEINTLYNEKKLTKDTIEKLCTEAHKLTQSMG